MKKMLIIVDVQEDFMLPDGALYVNGAENIIGDIINFIDLNKNNYLLIVETFDSHTQEQYETSSEKELFPIHCVKGSHGWESILGKFNYSNKVDLHKEVFDMWEPNATLHKDINELDVKLISLLDSYPPSIFEVDIIGVATDFCVKYAADGFLKLGYNVNILTKYTKGINQEAEHFFDNYHNNLFLK